MLRCNPEYGARPFKRVAQSELETPLAAPSPPPKPAKRPAAATQAKVNQKKKDKEPAMKSAAAVHAAPTKEAELVMVLPDYSLDRPVIAPNVHRWALGHAARMGEEPPVPVRAPMWPPATRRS